MATTDERKVLASVILPAIARESARLPQLEITGFLAMAGRLYNRNLMVVGRAVNGWTKGILPATLISSSMSEHYADQVLASVVGTDNCPMRWVMECWGNVSADYNSRRSAFWRVIRAVVAQLGIADVEEMTWPSHLVWSNLYKMAPANGGNPGCLLCELQLPGCIDLLRLELATYRPSRLLLLTGAGWADPFLRAMGATWQERPGHYVDGFGTIPLAGGAQVQFVVAVHPQGKTEPEWIKEVVDVYGR